MMNPPTRTLAELEVILVRISRRERLVEVYLEFLAQPIALESREVIEAASKAIGLATSLNDRASRAEAQYHRGLAYLQMSGRQVPVGVRFHAREIDMAIADLGDAYEVFSTMKIEDIEASEQRRRKGWRARDKARRKRDSSDATSPAISAAIALRAERTVSSALAMARACSLKNKIAESLRWCRLAREQCDPSRPTLLYAAACGALGDILRTLGSSEDALKYLRHAVATRRTLHDIEGTAGALAALALTHHEMDDLESALEYYRQSLDLYKEAGMRYRMLGDEQGEVLCQYQEMVARARTASVHLHQCEHSQALEEALLALFAFQKLLDHPGQSDTMAAIDTVHENIADTLVTIGRIYEGLQRPDEALERYADAYKIVESHCPPRKLLPILVQVAGIHRDRDETDESIGTYHVAIEIAEAIQEKYLLGQLHEKLAETYASIERYREAYDHYRAFAKIRNEITVEERKREVEIAKIQFDTEQKELEAARLKERNALLESEMAEFLVSFGLHGDLPAETSNREDGAVRGQKQVSDYGRKTAQVTAKRKWIYFQRRLEDLHPGFMAAVAAKGPTLTPRQLQVCALIRLGYTPVEIRTAFDIEERTLETHRNRIRARLNCRPGENLMMYLASIV